MGITNPYMILAAAILIGALLQHGLTAPLIKHYGSYFKSSWIAVALVLAISLIVLVLGVLLG